MKSKPQIKRMCLILTSFWFQELHVWSKKKFTSPPSPELDFPPNRFIAIAIASCVSLEIAPRDIPPVQKRRTMETADSTLPTGIGARSLLNSRRSRRTYVRNHKRCGSEFPTQDLTWFVIQNPKGLDINGEYLKTEDKKHKKTRQLTFTGRLARCCW